MFAVVDYKKGNLRSVARGLEEAGAQVAVTSDAREIERADAIVLPGVGAFTDAMNTMCELGQASAIQDAVSRDVPFLGICLGMHLMFEAGEEHAPADSLTSGLSLIPGVVRRIPRTNAEGEPFKVPHVGWNTVSVNEKESPIFESVSNGSFFYFTHSYIAPESNATVASTTHSVTFPSAVQTGNSFGVQFHPEKSSDVGQAMLASFVDFARKV